jgi:hypothetical protein
MAAESVDVTMSAALVAGLCDVPLERKIGHGKGSAFPVKGRRRIQFLSPDPHALPQAEPFLSPDPQAEPQADAFLSPEPHALPQAEETSFFPKRFFRAIFVTSIQNY